MIRTFASTSARGIRITLPPRQTTPAAARVMSTSTHAREFHSTPQRMDFHFDTHHFVQRLEREGLNRAQAEGIMSAMAEVIDESIRNMTSNMVTKADQEKVPAPLSFHSVCY